MASLLPSAGAPRKAPPALPLVTYFLHAGLSPRDAQDAARELLARVRSRILRLAATHTLEEQRRYVADWPYREQLNARLIAEEILLMLRELETDYEIYVSVGLNFRFGSLQSNVVNPRFGSGGRTVNISF